MGTGLSAYQNNQVFDFIVNGSFNFDGGATGNGFADFLLGVPTFFQQGRQHLQTSVASQRTHFFRMNGA